MNKKIPVEELLRWRLAQAEKEAPPAPRAARLLDQTRRWWETWPERFAAMIERLSLVQVAYGHAMTDASQGRSGFPVAALIDHAGHETEASVRVLYLSVRDRRLRFRFQLDVSMQPVPESFETTFISNENKSPVLSVQAMHSVDDEYRIDVEVPEQLENDWKDLKVTDHMPFRLILRSSSSTGGR
jgi:hypothetical protein